jgi:DNA-binding transcriptional LysR family regulator
MDGDMAWDDRIGRRLKLRDLHILMAVAQAGSMRRAAESLNTTQPVISRSIADLEHAMGVRLLDRSRQGIEPTVYGRTLLEGGASVFDDLRQAVKKIEFQVDPTVGDIRVGANDGTIAGLLPVMFGRLREKYPGTSIHVTTILPIAQQYRELRERHSDIILGRIASPIEDDIHAEVLFHDRIIVVAGPKSRWARRRKVELSELADEPWCLPPSDTLVGAFIADAFRTSGMKFPPRGVAMGSILLFGALLARGSFLAIFPASMLRFGANLPPLKILPVDLPIPPWPVGIMTLKNRTLTPVTQLFIDCAREVAKPLAKKNS